MNTQKKALFSAVVFFGFIAFSELSLRVVGAGECAPIRPDAGDWETMVGDPALLWKLEPNTEFRTGNDVTRINAVGLRERLLPTQAKKPGEFRVLLTGDSAALTAGTVAAANPGQRGATLAMHATLGFMGGMFGPLAIGMVLDGAGGSGQVLAWGLGCIAMGLGSGLALAAILLVAPREKS